MLAELGANRLNRPYERFDMSGYAHGHESSGLTGTPKMYQGAQPGLLTDFVQRNPRAILLFDEIEKAHHTVIHLLLQLLDGGRLEDKFSEVQVDFRNTIVIFTTNVGRSLYDAENTAGVHQANASFHRSTILDALRTEINPGTGAPFFSAALCSRLATGIPILFNHLRIQDLTRVVNTELQRVASLLEKQYGHKFAIGADVPLALVMRHGANADARTVKASAESFLKEEVFKACRLFADERVDAALDEIRRIDVQIDPEESGEPAQRIFQNTEKPQVLFITDPVLGDVIDAVANVDWYMAANVDQVFDILAVRSVDLVLLDLTLGATNAWNAKGDAHKQGSESRPDSYLGFDFLPLGSRKFFHGQQILEQLHARAPETPVYLMSFDDAPAEAAFPDIDDELLRACVNAGGARGVLRLVWKSDRRLGEMFQDLLVAQIGRVVDQLRKDNLAAELARRSDVLAFDTAPRLSDDGKQLEVRCRNFRFTKAALSADVKSLVSAIDRPTTRFSDVIGAQAAKDSLQFVCAWLREPKKYAAAGIEPPRGILLTGSPGTGKTMLARAVAGESECAFLAQAATAFVTKYQGSGPNAVRELFSCARRNYPSIVFIDEIDAIGGGRAEVHPGLAGHGEAMALNQLLIEMDGFASDPSKPVIVIAATNHAEKLDPALRRRFGRVIEVELPTKNERKQYLRLRFESKRKHAVSDQMLERIAIQAQGLSISDLSRVVAQASVLALQRGTVIDDTIVSDAFETFLHGQAKEGTDTLRTARHEAGHCLVMCALNEPPLYVTAVGRGDFGGYAARDGEDERRSRTRPELENLICQLLGGRAAELLYYGPDAGISTGPESDIQMATSIAEAMVCQYGMSEELGATRVDLSRAPAVIAKRCIEAAKRITQQQEERARALLESRKDALDRVAAALLERNRLLKDELLEIVASADATSVGGVVGHG